MSFLSTDPRRSPEWYRNQWTCEICHTTIRKNHRSGHMKSKGHIARATRSTYITKESDDDFTRFLQTVTEEDLSDSEFHIYLRMKNKPLLYS